MLSAREFLDRLKLAHARAEAGGFHDTAAALRKVMAQQDVRDIATRFGYEFDSKPHTFNVTLTSSVQPSPDKKEGPVGADVYIAGGTRGARETG